jgi:TPR repeat protein
LICVSTTLRTDWKIKFRQNLELASFLHIASCHHQVASIRSTAMQLRWISSGSIKFPIVMGCLWAAALIASATSLPADAEPVFARDYRGAMYAQSGDTTADQATAGQWYRKAADQEYVPAQFNLGAMYADGRDVAEAVQWYSKAAAQNHAAAQFNLGRMYAEGRGVAKDEAAALQWFQKAAAQGFAPAQQALQSRGSRQRTQPQVATRFPRR